MREHSNNQVSHSIFLGDLMIDVAPIQSYLLKSSQCHRERCMLIKFKCTYIFSEILHANIKIDCRRNAFSPTPSPNDINKSQMKLGRCTFKNYHSNKYQLFHACSQFHAVEHDVEHIWYMIVSVQQLNYFNRINNSVINIKCK